MSEWETSFWERLFLPHQVMELESRSPAPHPLPPSLLFTSVFYVDLIPASPDWVVRDSDLVYLSLMSQSSLYNI